MNKLKIAGVRLGDELIPKQPHRHTVRSKASWTHMMSFSHTMRKQQESISNVRDSADTETWEVFYEEDVSVVGLAEGWKWGRETQIQREIEIQRERDCSLLGHTSTNKHTLPPSDSFLPLLFRSSLSSSHSIWCQLSAWLQNNQQHYTDFHLLSPSVDVMWPKH